MRICDVCFLPGEVKPVQAAVGIASSTSKEALWQYNDMPEFCAPCRQLLASRSWVAIGKTHEEALQRFMKFTGKDPTTT